MRVRVIMVLLLALSGTSWSMLSSQAEAAPEAGPLDPVSYSPDAGMEPLVPARVLDTREGLGAPAGAVAAGGTIELQITGHGGVPATGVGAVVMNVTAVAATAPSFVTVWPTGVDRPLASNLNVLAGDTIPNLVIVKVGAGGKVNLFNNSGNVHLLADVVGWFGEGSGLEPLVPARVLDTREGLGAPAGAVAAGGTIELQITGHGGVPATGVGAVVMNVTAVAATAPSFVTVWPTGVDRPLASNLNVLAGDTIPNLVIVKVGAGGKVNLFNNSGNVHLLADVVGWFGEGSGLEPLVPARVLDTREGLGAPAGAVAAGGTIELQITGHGGVPATGVGAVVMNVTAVAATAPSFVTVWPTGVDRPLASNLNVLAGDTIPNLVIVKVGAGGKVNLFNNSGNVHLLADVVGWFGDGDGSNLTFALKPGSVIAGAGDVVSFTGDSESGATVVMSGAADLPPVGGHLSVFPHSTAPTGLAGSVVTSTPNADGTTTLVLAAANLQDIFAEFDFSGSRATQPVGVQAARVTNIEAVQCSGNAPIAPTLSLTVNGFGGTARYSLADQYAKIEVHATIVLTAAFNVSAGVECTYPFPTFLLGLIGPLATEFGYEGFISIGGQMSGSVEVSVPVTLGFEYDQGNITNLSDAALDGSGEMGGPTISATAGARAILYEKIAGVAGVKVQTGPEVTFSYDFGENCAKIEAQYRIALVGEIGRWGVTWGFTIAEVVFGPILIHEINCPQWFGSIENTMTWSQPDSEFSFEASYDVDLVDDPSMTWNLEQHDFVESGLCGRVESETYSSGSDEVSVNVFISGPPFELGLTSTRPEGALTGVSRTCTVGDGGQGLIAEQPVSGPFYPYPIGSAVPCTLPPIPVGEHAQAVRDSVECDENGAHTVLTVALKRDPCDTTIDSDSDGTGDCAEYDAGGNPNG